MECDPRIAVVPPYERTAGPQIVRIAAVAGIGLDEAQRFLAAAAGGVGADGKWAAFENVIFAPRQNIKTEFLLARILAGLFVFREELIVYSAHQARTTAKTFKRLKRAIEKSPELGGRITRVSNRSGAEMIELASGQTVECVARSTGSGRGFTGDCVILDEAQNLDGDQLAAILPMLSTRPNPQVIYALSLGNEDSSHLGALRARALARQDPHVCWIEWSMGEGDRADDRAVWRACNPAVAAGRITMDYLEREYLALGLAGFAAERLGKSNWPADPSQRFAVISRAAWERCYDPVLPEFGRLYPVSFGAAVSAEGRSGAVAVCGTLGGARALEITDHRPGEGVAWLGLRLGELTSRHDTHAAGWDDRRCGPLGLASYTGGTTVVTPKPAELAEACARLFYAAEDPARLVRHRGDQRLTDAVGAALMRPLGGGWVWADTPGAEVLAAATMALHAAAAAPEPVRPFFLWGG
jgi:hypothetical protein